MILEPTSIRSLLIRAWRERWSDIQWGIHIKTVLPRYISGDIYHLSDSILQQALIGSLPNTLILSYLHHSLASKVVSFHGVIESICKYDPLKKPYCIHALLNLLQSMLKNISCKGKAEECLQLASSIVAEVIWLCQVIKASITRLIELQSAPEHVNNLNLSISVLQQITSTPFLLCLFHLGCDDDPTAWEKCVTALSQLKSDFGAAPASIAESKEQIATIVREFEDVKTLCAIKPRAPYDCNDGPICNVVFSLVMLEVMKHTTRDASVFTRQLLLVQNVKGLTLCDLYLELIRSCFIGLSAQEFKKYQELKWVGFTYIKLPSIIHTIHTSIYGESTFSVELLAALQRISSMTTLLDVVDYRVRCNCLEYLFKELIPKVPQPTQASQPPSYDLVAERDAQTILAERMLNSNVLRTLKTSETQGSPLSSPDLILRAQPTVIGILKTLANKNLDSVMTVLSLLISGKSRELLLIAAASSGSLGIYAQKFVRLNEHNKDPVAGETPKQASNRALVFDISFLLLCHIAQVYGVKVVVSESGDTFIEQWIQDNIPELGKTNPVVRPSASGANAGNMEEFLRQINSTDDSKYVGSNLAEKCKLSSLLAVELISGSSFASTSKQAVFDFLDKLCLHLCSLPICVTAWLCCYIQQLEGEEATNAKELLTYMQSKFGSQDATQSALETFKDRSNLMFEIMNHMSELTTESCNGLGFSSASKPELSSAAPLNDVLEEVWKEINDSNGLLSHKILETSKQLLRVGNTKWFVANFVKAALDNVFERELVTAIDVTFGVLHLDIVSTTLSFLIDTLPAYISGRASADLLCEPRTSALGRLAAMLMVECWAEIQPSKSSGDNESSTVCRSKGLKRTFSQLQLDDLEQKFRSMQSSVDVASLELEEEATVFLSAVHNVFTLMAQVNRTAVVSPVMHLIVFILKELVSTPYSAGLLALIHPSLLSNLLPLLPPSLDFDYQQLLALTSPSPSPASTIFPVPLESTVLGKRNLRDSHSAAAKILCVKRNLELIA